MVDISFNCQLFQDIEKNYTFTIIVNTTNSIEIFKKNIKEKIKQIGNDIFDETKNKNIKKLEGFISNYWQDQPSKKFTHIIINSPYLIILRELNNLNFTDIILQQLYNKQYIKQENILLYNRTYKNVKFIRKFKIKDIYNTGKILINLTINDNKEILMLFDNLSKLELNIFRLNTCFKNIEQATGNVYDWFFIIDKNINKGSITELRK
ncbi:hypothetical protein GLOIN_2v1652895 [Rhizophagus clarus]|uniref:Uncharacterized protein n=1 Tax=Rhizophagus clarus TaxID=94130 RepID=A0A8H3MD17_9GLOM|nr:hypothetical protein GLOIN_2v1652895 [Rhizophagus clarus]